MAPPPNTAAEAPHWVQFVPLFLVTVPIAILLWKVAKRKGRNPYLYLFLGFVPLANFLAVFWLASQTDLDVLIKLDELETRLDATKDKNP